MFFWNFFFWLKCHMNISIIIEVLGARQCGYQWSSQKQGCCCPYKVDSFYSFWCKHKYCTSRKHLPCRYNFKLSRFFGIHSWSALNQLFCFGRYNFICYTTLLKCHTAFLSSLHWLIIQLQTQFIIFMLD